MPARTRVVVVGAGLAGVRTAQALGRAAGPPSVRVIGAETLSPYDRPPLSKEVLRGDLESVPLDGSWAAGEVELQLGATAVALDTSTRIVRTDDGSEIDYDALVIASGARARQLPGLTGAGVHVLRTLQDSHRLHHAIRQAGHITIVGAGFIGCEVAATARQMGATVTLVEAMSAPLLRALGVEVGNYIAERHREAGVDLRCGQPVAGVHDSPSGRRLELADGQSIPAELVLVALGVTPDVDWLSGSGIAVDDGVLCDEFGRSSMPGVWAAGDVARWYNSGRGAHHRHEHWTSANEQADIVARDITGADQLPGDDVAYFWSSQYDLRLQMLGTPAAEDDVTLLRLGDAPRRMLAIYAKDGAVTAALGTNMARSVMRMRPLIARSARLAEALSLATA